MTVKIEIFGEDAAYALHELQVFSAGLVGRPAATAEATAEATGAEAVANITDQAAEKQEVPKRERGKPAAGRARRTKEEIAEDEAADAAEASAPVAQISTGENRVGPEDDAETEAQDKADEQAEVAATRKDPITLDDVKALAVQYQQTYGPAAVQEDGPKLFADALGNPPDGQQYWKFSILPTDAESLAKLQQAWRGAVENNPYKREKV